MDSSRRNPENETNDERHSTLQRESRSQRLCRLEQEAQLTITRLREATSELNNSPVNEENNLDIDRESNRSHYGVTDINIQEAMRYLHTPTRRRGETSDEYDARKVASKQLKSDRQEADLKEERRRECRLRKEKELCAEAKKLRQERKEYTREEQWRTDQLNKLIADSIQEKDADMRRKEHY